MVISMFWWDLCVEVVLEDYLEISWDKQYIDILLVCFVMQFECFDVVVVLNLFGDILFDLGLVCIGIIGLVFLVNLNFECKFLFLFELVYGFVLDIYGKNIVNFIGMIWFGVLMFSFLIYDMGVGKEVYDVIVIVIEYILKGSVVILDLGGEVLMQVMGEVILVNF